MKVCFLSNRSIRIRVISVLLILCFIFSMSYIFLFQQHKEDYQTELDQKMHFTEMTATSMDDFIESHKITLQKLAALDSVEQERRSEILQTLQDLAIAQPEVSQYWVTNEKGEMVGKYPDMEADQSILDRDYFKQTLQGNTMVSGPYIGRVTGNEVIIITAPYYRDYKVVGLVGMSVPLSKLQEILEEYRMGQAGYTVLINYEDGQILSHPNLEQFRKSFSYAASPIYRKMKTEKLKSGYFENVQEQNMHFFMTLKEAPWVAILVQPSEEFNYKVNQRQGRNFTILVLLILSLVLLGHYLLMLRDMKNAEKNKETEKLAIIGELAAGIAHEVRNPLTSIKGFMQLIYEKKGQGVPAFYYETILEELDRIDQIVGQMVVLAKPAPETNKEIDLNKVLQDTVNLMSYQASLREIDLVLNLEPELPHIEGVNSQLKQVFINLIKNAIEAIDKDGTVTIRTKRQEEKVMIMIEDTGPGMEKEVIEKLGTPFFSTKEAGTGLGLVISYRIIQNHKGEVWVQSKVGVGTQFIIALPLFNNQIL